MPPKPTPGDAAPAGPEADRPRAPAGRPPATVELDESRNLITIKYFGNVTPAATKKTAADAKGLIARVRPGFTVLTDLSGLDSMDLDCAPDLSGVMDAFRAAGVRTVIRIIPDPAKDIGLNILAIVHYRRGVRVVTCETAAEAERALKK